MYYGAFVSTVGPNPAKRSIFFSAAFLVNSKMKLVQSIRAAGSARSFGRVHVGAA